MKIAADYAAGDTSLVVARRHQVSEQTVMNCLADAGVEPREQFHIPTDQLLLLAVAYDAGMSSTAIGEIFGVTGNAVLVHLERMGIERRPSGETLRKYPIDHNAFSAPSPEAAYWTGFIMADGCVHQQRLIVALNAVDADHLRRLACFVGSPDRPIPQRWATTYTPNGATYEIEVASLKFHSSQLVSDLAQRGVTERKSLHAEASAEMAMSPSFWLGVADGDGSISTTGIRDVPRFQLIGSETLMHQFSNFVESIIGRKPSVRKRKNRRLWEVSLSNTPAREVVRVLLSEGVTPLARKNPAYERATTYINRSERSRSVSVS